MAPHYNTLQNTLQQGSSPSPYGSGDPYYNESSGFITPKPVKKRSNTWLKIGIPVLIVVIIAAVVGGVVGSRNKKSSSSSNGNGTTAGEAAASSAVSAKLAIGRFATATNSEFMVPVYPSTVSSPSWATFSGS